MAGRASVRSIVTVRCAILILVLAGCAAARAPEYPVSHEPPRAVAVRTGRFVLRASAWVELYASMEGADGNVVMRLLHCEDETCARSSVAGTAQAAVFDTQLGAYVRHGWAEDAAVSRLAMDRAIGPLLRQEEVLVERLVADLAIDRSREPVTVAVTHRARKDLPTVDLVAGCLTERAAVGCVLACAARALAERSAVYRAMGEGGPRLWPFVSAFAAQAIVGRHGRMPSGEGSDAIVAWLAREWPKRTGGEESASDFGARAARELGGR